MCGPGRTTRRTDKEKRKKISLAKKREDGGKVKRIAEGVSREPERNAYNLVGGVGSSTVMAARKPPFILDHILVVGNKLQLHPPSAS